MKREYLILLIIIIVGLVAIFSLTFLMAGDQNVAGAAAAWGKCDCQGADAGCCAEIGCTRKDGCESCGGHCA
jgi:hypothetical protein